MFINGLDEKVVTEKLVSGIFLLPPLLMAFYLWAKFTKKDPISGAKIDTDPKITSLISDEIYEQAAVEVESGKYAKDLWTRLLVENDGDESNAKIAYMKYRPKELALFKYEEDTKKSKLALALATKLKKYFLRT